VCAAAAPPTARLVYSRAADADSCPDEGALRRAVAARVGYDPFFAWAQRTVVANIVRRNGAFVAAVDLVDERGIAHGARELQAPGECGELLDAVALAIAIAIDPQSLAGPTAAQPAAADEPPPPAPASLPVPTAPPERPAVPPPPMPAAAARAVGIEPSVGAVASNGVAPSVALGVALGAALRWRSMSVAVEGRLDAPASTAAQGGGDVSSWLALAALVPCAYLGRLLACGLLQGGSMQASGNGVLNAQSRAAGWWAAGGRAGVLLPVAGEVILRPRVDVLADLSRATLVLNGRDAWSADPVAISLGLDVVLRFR
jgi:hypothetical protein